MRRAFADKQIMLIGVTGFIGKVWLANTLLDLPAVQRIYLLIRRQKSNPGERRFEKMIEDSPVFDPLFERHGDRLPEFLREKLEVVEGDVTQPGLGLSPEIARSLQKNLDLIINSSGLTDFNPDLRDALATNTDAPLNVLDFVRELRPCRTSASFHLLRGRRAGWPGQRKADVPTTIRAASPTSMPNRNGAPCMTWSAGGSSEPRAKKSPPVCAMQAQSKEHAAKNLQGRGSG